MPDRPMLANAEEIEITSEMIEAGALVLLRRFNLDADEGEVTAEIYRAMELARMFRRPVAR